MSRLVAALALAAACSEPKREAPAPPAPQLPGAIWFVADGPPRELVRLAGGARRAWPAGLYPSEHVLPDGRLVAIASRGDGSPDSEQLALISERGVERVGPVAPQVRDPAVDPAGRWIVVAANPDAHSDLYRIDLASGQTSRLTDDAAGNFAPAALGGDAIAFASSRDGDSELYRMPVAGGAAQRLTAFHRDDWQATPSPDATTIAFLSDREGPPRIFLMAADGTNQRRLTARTDPDREERDPIWSPDGRSLAYLVAGRGEAHVWVRDLATGTERALTPPGAHDAEPSWSPDGAWLVVSRDRQLWAMPVAGGDPVRVATSKGTDRLPRWVAAR